MSKKIIKCVKVKGHYKTSKKGKRYFVKSYARCFEVEVDEDDEFEDTYESLDMKLKVLNLKGDMLQKEKEVTELLKNSTNSKVKLKGLKYSIKGTKSILRKIKTEIVENDWTLDEVFDKDLKDVLRYTFEIEDNVYWKEFDNIIKSINEKGYETLKIKDYWDGEFYKGINANFLTKVGKDVVKMEIQFHTPLSYITKGPSHDLYEIYREVNVDKLVKENAKQEMIKMWSVVDTPPK